MIKKFVNSSSKFKLVLFDVGAGGQSNINIENISKNSLIDGQIFLIEPSQYMPVKKLKNSHVIRAAISNEKGDATLWDPEVGGASLYEKDKDFVYRYVNEKAFLNKVQEEKIRLITFSEIAKEKKIENVDAIKIDTQGSELNILNNFKKSGCLDNCFLVEVEVPSLPICYKGQPKLSDICKFFEEHDFWLGAIKANYAQDISHKKFFKKKTLLDEKLPYISQKKPMDIDCIFFANPIKIITSKDSEIIKRYVLVLAGWGFYLESISILGEAYQKNIISLDEYSKVEASIKEFSKMIKPQLRFWIMIKVFKNKLLFLARNIKRTLLN